MVVLVSPDVSPKFREIMHALGISIHGKLFVSSINIINKIQDIPKPPRHRNYTPLYEKWADMLSKFELWNLDPDVYPKLLYLDSDFILMRDPSWIFDFDVEYLYIQPQISP